MTNVSVAVRFMRRVHVDLFNQQNISHGSVYDAADRFCAVLRAADTFINDKRNVCVIPIRFRRRLDFFASRAFLWESDRHRRAVDISSFQICAEKPLCDPRARTRVGGRHENSRRTVKLRL